MRKSGSALARIFILVLIIALAGTTLDAKTRRKKRRRVVPPEPPIVVVPSAAIEDRVRYEVALAVAAINEPSLCTLLESRYLVSALYYHDGFLSSFKYDQPDADPSRRIISQINRYLVPERKRMLLRTLDNANAGIISSTPFTMPVADPEIPKKRRSRTHEFAVDMFLDEGSAVFAATAGIVVLAEGKWTQGDLFSTSSIRGGNAVIIYRPESRTFYRYCHLANVEVRPGMWVNSGEVIGTVGHTGHNASREGHGRHLHLEINEVTEDGVGALNRSEILKLLSIARPAPRTLPSPPLLLPEAYSPPLGPPAELSLLPSRLPARDLQ